MTGRDGGFLKSVIILILRSKRLNWTDFFMVSRDSRTHNAFERFCLRLCLAVECLICFLVICGLTLRFSIFGGGHGRAAFFLSVAHNQALHTDLSFTHNLEPAL